jgi:hypothetical protein
MDDIETAGFEALAEQGRRHTKGMLLIATTIHGMVRQVQDQDAPLSKEDAAWTGGLVAAYRMLLDLPATEAGARAATEHAWSWIESLQTQQRRAS